MAAASVGCTAVRQDSLPPLPEAEVTAAPQTSEATAVPEAQPEATEEPQTEAEPEAGTAQIAVGSILVFGAYEQDADPENGLEPVEWIVLERDGDTLLLVSRLALDAQPYDLAGDDATWETSSLRAWLNEDFLEAAFLPEEQDCILTSDVPADKNPEEDTDPGNATQDRLFLLSTQEAGRFFPTEGDRYCGVTAYAHAIGSGFSQDGTCQWWLRTPGNGQSYASFCGYFGSFDHKGKSLDHDDFGIRPALRASISALEGVMEMQNGQRTAHEPTPTMELEALKSAETGSVIVFGSYEQDGDRENGTEPIEWIVLERDGTKLLLLSRYTLDAHLYDGSFSTSVSWEGSSLRGWLNHCFYAKAFAPEERQRILTSLSSPHENVSYPDTDQGMPVQDKFFVLSAVEAGQYLHSDAERDCRPTSYARSRAERSGIDKDTTLPWWLRTLGLNMGSPVIVRGNGGTVNDKGTWPWDHNPMVRPAILIDAGA